MANSIKQYSNNIGDSLMYFSCMKNLKIKYMTIKYKQEI